jgi:CubicO group peptidase (beta-lactamase class C family)
MSRHDLLWYHAPWSPEETVRRLAHVKPSHSFRSVYEYNNIMYLAAGYAVASASKSTWHDFAQRRIFTPLGMKGAVFTRSAVLRTPDHASPHHQGEDGKLRIIPWYDDDQQIRASGSIKASVRDLALWMRFQLGDGTFAGKRLLSARRLEETHTPQMIVRLKGTVRAAFPDTIQLNYGLGWFVHDYRGHLVWSHTGSTDGFRSRIVLVPRARLGIAFLTNADVGADHASMHRAVTNQLVDHLLGLPAKDWDAHYAALANKWRDEQFVKKKSREAKRRQGTKPSHPLEAYAGTYKEPAYGNITVAVEKGTLVFRWSSFTGRLEHFHFDTFTAKADRPVGDEQAVFDQGADGSVSAMRFLGVTFKRK